MLTDNEVRTMFGKMLQLQDLRNEKFELRMQIELNAVQIELLLKDLAQVKHMNIHHGGDAKQTATINANIDYWQRRQRGHDREFTKICSKIDRLRLELQIDIHG